MITGKWKEVFESLVANTWNAVDHYDSDYQINGILYCGLCDTPKQKRMYYDNVGEFFPYHPCKCQKERMEREKRENAQAEHEKRVKQLTAACFGDYQNEMIKKTFGNSDDGETSKQLNVCRKYAVNFADALKKGIGLLMYGSVGTGKSYAAVCIANELLNKEVSVLFTNFSEMIRQVQGAGFDEKQAVLDEFQRYDLLIIDDLGVERSTGFTNEIMTNVIENRCKSGKPLIITTNLSPDKLTDADNITEQRLYSRLLECCIPLKFTGVDKRRKISDDKKSEFLRLLDVG